MASVLSALESWRAFNAIVVGDFMLDQLVYGDADRLSPDAPVPVLQVRRTENRPGGAASVCLDLAALRGRVRAFGVVGEDPEGRVLRDAIEEAGIDASGLIADGARPTTVKRSLVGLAQHRHPQKMFRLDMESRTPLGTDATQRLLARIEAALPEADVVCLEDYAKGVCSPELCQGVIALARKAGVPALVDPAALEDYGRYRGATAATPNRTEAALATGAALNGRDDAEEPEAMARALLEAMDADAMVVTLDREGALLAERTNDADAPDGVATRRLPTVARQVYDVTGAGDMVLAALGAARANGVSWTESVRFANAAAGLEVEVFGVQPIPLERIHHQLLMEGGRTIGKLRTPEEARVEAAARRRDGQRIVFTNGCFDILHAGHVSLLRRARAHGDVLFLGVNTDASVRRLKGPDRPVHEQADRAAVLSELESVDALVLFEEDTPLSLIEAIRPDVLVKGADYTRETVVGAELVESWGGRVELVDLLEGRSTTGAIERIRSVEAGEGAEAPSAGAPTETTR